ncbi:MAG: porin family protein [Methylococcales bacterium]
MTLNKTNKHWGIAAATLTMASALIAPQAMAGSKAELGNSKVQALESQVNEMADMLRSMQSELDAVRNEAKQQPVAAAPAPVKTKDNMVFFRGGFASMDHKRDGVSIYSDVAGSQLGLPGGTADKDAWYFGAGFDFSLTDDVWGMADSTEILAELMFEYKEFSSNVQGNVLAQNPTALAAGSLVSGNNPLLANDTRTVTVNQFSLTASPKIKFMKGSDFRPWIIPVGFALHVVSPPSESITVLNPGMMFGAGADYRIWKDIFVGVDGRYHLTSSAADGVNTDGFTAGGYLGIGF